MAIGTLLILLQKHEVTVANRMRSWPSTLGSSVVSRGIERLQDGQMGEFIYTGVTYEVAGHTYKLSVREYGGHTTTANAPDPTPTKNASTRVYYDPEDPSDWSLTNDRHVSVAGLWIGRLLFLLGVPFWYLAARWYRTPLR